MKFADDLDKMTWSMLDASHSEAGPGKEKEKEKEKGKEKVVVEPPTAAEITQYQQQSPLSNDGDLYDSADDDEEVLSSQIEYLQYFLTNPSDRQYI